MALGKLLIILAVIAIVIGDFQHEVKTENKTKKTLAAEKEQKSRSANPGKERGSLQQLTNMMNRTSDRRQNRRRGKQTLNTIRKLADIGKKPQSQNQNDTGMLNDNEGFAMSEKTIGNDSNSLSDKMKALRHEGPTYVAMNKDNYVPQVTGVFCNFESGTNASFNNMCMWQWNASMSRHGLGFQVGTAADIVKLNESSKDFKFSAPPIDADGNVGGEPSPNRIPT